jgi:hypothetical protein
MSRAMETTVVEARRLRGDETSVALDRERFHRLVDGLTQVVQEPAPEVLSLSRRQEQPIGGTLGQSSGDHLEVGADHAGQIFEGLWKL